MKQFRAFVLKEFYHIFRDKRTVLIVLCMPIVQIILFGFAISMEVQHIRTAIFDPSKDEVTTQISDQLAASSYFEVVKQLKSPSEVESLLKKGEIDLAILFGNQFSAQQLRAGDAQIQIISNASDPNTAMIATNYASAIISSVVKKEQGTVAFQIEPQVKMLYNPQMKSAYNFVPGVMGLILMLICAMMTSISIVREKETGTMEILLVSPVKPIYLILAKTIPYLVLSTVNLITILLLSVFVLQVPIAGSLLLLSSLSLLFIVVSLSLGLFISNIAPNQVAAMLISGMALMMPTMILSGIIFPIENMPVPLQLFSNIIPAKWYIMGVKKVMIQGLPIEDIVAELSVLVGMALFLLATSLKMFKIRL